MSKTNNTIALIRAMEKSFFSLRAVDLYEKFKYEYEYEYGYSWYKEGVKYKGISAVYKDLQYLYSNGFLTKWGDKHGLFWRLTDAGKELELWSRTR